MDALALLRQHEPILKKRFGVANIGIFGSFVRGEERPESDVDVLVTFRKGEETFDHSMDCRFSLEDLFGRNVDLVRKGAIKPGLREYILGEVVSVSNGTPVPSEIPEPAVFQGHSCLRKKFPYFYCSCLSTCDIWHKMKKKNTATGTTSGAF